MKKLTQSSHGQYLLHVWREGQEYYRQKSPIFLKEFTNMMFSVFPQPPDSPILYHDLTKPLPFESNSFHAINAYHVFEHLSLRDGERFAVEIERILKPGGIFRISVPDLERIAREYIDYLEKSLRDPSLTNLQRYHWTVLEMIDQATRDKTGGMMMEAVKAGNLDTDFIMERYSDVFAPFLKKEEGSKKTSSYQPPPPKSIGEKLSPAHVGGAIKRRLDKLLYQVRLKNKRWQTGGEPRKTKEAVRWMHDRLSLRILVEKTGFVDFHQMDFNKSDIPHWNELDLDQSNNGGYAIDPSVYVECRKKR
jgi:SAM-dependent methyltransferase